MTDRDGLRRALRDAATAQRDAVPALAELTDRIAQDDPTLSGAARQAILGLPDRRQFLRIGGVSVLGAAILAGCKKDKHPVSIAGGDAATLGTDSPAPSPLGRPDDQTLLRTAASLEALAVDVYGKAAPLLKTPAVVAAANLFKDHHSQHLEAINASITGAKVTQPNAAVDSALVEPALKTITDEQGALGLAIALETAAAETYTFAASSLDEVNLRAQLMTIGGVEARHRAVLHMVLKRPPVQLFPASFYRNTNPLPTGAVISS
jgi:Ferritin-like domain